MHMRTLDLSDKSIDSISQDLDMGMACFVHIETGEIVTYPDPLKFDLEFDDNADFWKELIDKVEREGEKFVQIEAMGSFEAFEVMEDFANSLPDSKFKYTLLEILEEKKPFRNFRNVIDDSEYRQDWFDFKNAANKKFVEDQVNSHRNMIQMDENFEPEKDMALDEVFDKEEQQFLNMLKERFILYLNRHPHTDWAKVLEKLRAQPERIQILMEMESTGGEPDVVEFDYNSSTDEIVFADCSLESPAGRRSLCYDREAWEGRKKTSLKAVRWRWRKKWG